LRTYLPGRKKMADSVKFIVVIKPYDKNNYKGIVKILDEMAINNIKKYALADIPDKEVDFTKSLK